jgi:hypothetical protein
MRREMDAHRLRDIERRLEDLLAAVDRLAIQIGDVDERSRDQAVDMASIRDDVAGLRAAVQLPPSHGAGLRARGPLRLLRP